jgi:uncharacterized protein YfaS (alpha-2-macroglobulin family)
MQRSIWIRTLALLVVATVGFPLCSLAVEENAPPERDALMKLYSDGNYAEAYDGIRRLVLSKDADPVAVSGMIAMAVHCLEQVNRLDEADAFREEAVAAHPDDWQLLAQVAQSYVNTTNYGFMIAGEFHRGSHRGGGRVMNAAARDRVRALQLLRQAIEQVEAAHEQPQAGWVMGQLARTLLFNNGYHQAWRLQSLTDLATLPDYEEGWGYYSGEPQGAPVDAEGNPVFYNIPTSWDATENDGQRWRWALEQWVEWNPSARPSEQYQRAEFLQNQFGVQTLANYWGWNGRSGDDDTKRQAGIWAVDTLGEDETIARLATGIKRLKLPDEQNFIKLYQKAAEADSLSYDSYTRLASLFADRRQYLRAADYWRLALAKAPDDDRKDSCQRELDQIVGNWGQFDSVTNQPAGQGATVGFRFRNAKQVDFVAHEVNVRKLLDDVKAYLKSKPKELSWEQVNISEIGYRLVQNNQQQYIGKQAAQWKLELEPRENHFDRRITVTTPLQKAGAYLLTAKVQNGNTCQIILWLSDTAIVQKPMPGKSFYYVADAVSGKPVAKANVEFFGFRQQHLDANDYQLDIEDFAEHTDKNGQAFLPVEKDRQDQYQWVAIATTPEGRLAYLGFQGVWRAEYYDEQYQATKTYVITDRPVYRPDQTVQFKVWVRQAQYDLADDSRFAHQSFQVEIRNPKDEKVYSETLTTDNYGGLVGSLVLPSDATLGQYRLMVVNHGGGTFRVEEYKKPEFEVTVDAPAEPVMLGEKITATIRAKYYFGSPVVEAQVKYKVLRTEHTGRWYPPGPWDWLYGPGYWWFGCDYDWYPGWSAWGCRRPLSWWIWRAPTPPEVVASGEVPIGPDGTLEIPIDTSLAKEMHPDQDHRYEIQAEVVDQSRRTIVGSGQVLVAREPFKVCAWVDRGYYRVGDTITANFAARRLDGQPVQGTGKLQLLKISYDAAQGGKPVETEVRSWDLATNAQGQAELPIKASEKGQYRLAYRVTDSAEHTIEGGYIFTIIGEGFDGSDFRFNDLEIVPDKREYAPGEKVRLQVNTNRVGSTVLLFARPANGIYLPPQTLRLKGKSTVVELDVTQKDMPNFFVEAVTVSDARVHTEAREIHVPPAKRILSVEVVPSADAYQPGQHAKLKLKLTDAAGQPFVGSTVVTIFDKSVEYISGGTNVTDIKKAFWDWRRQHHPHTSNSLDRWSPNLTRPNETAMESLGVFGDTVADKEQMPQDRSNMAVQTSAPAMAGWGGGGFAVPRSAALGAAAPDEQYFGDGLRRGMAVSGLSKGESADMAANGEAPAELVEPTIRKEFADTALWIASLETDKDGLAEATLDMPENLTTWKVRVWAMGQGTRVGEAATEVVTRKNLIIRMQAPRFFVERDEVVLTANVHNYLPDAKQVKVRLEQDGNMLELPGNVEQTVEIPAGGEKRVDWRVKVVREGEAVLRMLALSDAESDAVEMRFPVLVHGMLKMDSYSGVLRPEDERGTFEIAVPAERRAEQTRLEVRYSPTLAGAMVDALPYLVDYPYGCTEQTLNRFLPAVITQQTLLKMGLDLKAIQAKRTNLNAQELGDAAERAKGWQRFERNPVFDEADLSKVVKASVQRLTEMQLSDGGWGWFSGWGEYSSPHTTALVVHGLQIAQQNDVAIVPGVVERGIAWLKAYQDRQLAALANVDEAGKPIDKTKPYKHHADNMDALVYMVLVDGGVTSDAMRDYLYRDRTELAVYGLATYGLALHKQGEADKLAMVMRNIGQYVVEDDENQTAYLNMPGAEWWYWYGSEIEAEAYYLKLLVATEPKSPVARRLVKYLVNSRKHATYWDSTRDTALVIEAMADYLKATGEAKPDLTVEVWIDGQKRKAVKITPENLFTFEGTLVVTGDALEPGRHTVELRKTGTGPLYYNGYLTNFTLEGDIRHAGLELKVERHYYKLTPVDASIEAAGGRGQVVNQRVEKYRRDEIPNLGTVTSGDLVEIELVIESKNDYEYVVFEDMKAAGCEAVALQSGYNGNELGAYMELRDESVMMFARRLARGRHSVSYRMRAEIPGRFSALPTRAYAMYAPELKGNSDELKLNIEDTGVGGQGQ